MNRRQKLTSQVTYRAAKCLWCGKLSTDFKLKGLWSAGHWFCPLCVKRMSPRKATDYAYRSECFQCEFYRTNMYGGLSLDGEPENPRYICLKFEAKENCVFDEPEPARVIKTAPPSARTPTVTPLSLVASLGPEPKLPSSLPPRTEPITLIPPASALPNKPELKSPAPKLRYPPRRKRRQK